MSDDDCCECAEDCCDCDACLPGNCWCLGGRCWCVCSDSGVLFAGITWMVIGFVGFVVEAKVIEAMEWAPFHRVAYSLVLALIYLSHGTAMWSDPGFVADTDPDALPSLAASPMSGYCKRCECVKPEGAHHCSTCNRCVRKMDHHCSWVNNCVGERNLKHFVLFLSYVALATCYSTLLILYRWLVGRGFGGRIYYSAPEGTGGQSRPDNSHLVGGSALTEVQCVAALLLSLGFLAFVCVMGSDIHESIITGTPTIDQLQGKYNPDGSRTLISALSDVCGERPSWRWVIPVAVRAPPPRDKEE